MSDFTDADIVAGEILIDWMAESGLGKLDPDDRWVIDDIESVRNANGILFRQMMAQHFEKTYGHEAAGKWFGESIKISRSLEVLPGLFNRNIKGHHGQTEAHDNSVAHCHAHVSRGSHQGPREMVRWAKDHSYCFNNIEPERWSFQQCRQPGEIGLYYACALLEPPAICWSWLLAGLWSNAAHRATPGQVHLAWFRIELLDMVGARKMRGWRGERYVEVTDFWRSQLVKNWGSLANVTSQYFIAEHPINGLVKTWEGKIR